MGTLDLTKKSMKSKNTEVHLFFEEYRICREVHVRLKAHVETVGHTAVSLNCIDGDTLQKPSGGTESHPVRKVMTSLRLGEPPDSPVKRFRTIWTPGAAPTVNRCTYLLYSVDSVSTS